MKRQYPVEILWCANRSGFAAKRNGWSFPTQVAKQIQTDTQGMTLLHLFGGLSKFGVRLDVDPQTRPDVIGDAWMPPFGKDSFDVVVLDPPYIRLNQQEKNSLLHVASYLAKRYIIWFHTLWIAADRNMRTEKAYLVRVGDTCQVRCLQYFRVTGKREHPPSWFSRGPAMKYNKWMVGNVQLPFPKIDAQLK